jgi:hypothetical protein
MGLALFSFVAFFCTNELYPIPLFVIFHDCVHEELILEVLALVDFLHTSDKMFFIKLELLDVFPKLPLSNTSSLLKYLLSMTIFPLMVASIKYFFNFLLYHDFKFSTKSSWRLDLSTLLKSSHELATSSLTTRLIASCVS